MSKKNKDKKPNGACHVGNTIIHTIGEHSLYAGGWSRGVEFGEGDIVIDLTGDQMPGGAQEAIGHAFPNFMKTQANVHAWLSMPMKDYGVPYFKLDEWKAMTQDIKTALKTHDVVVFCMGGHGRTGMFCSIVGYLLNGGKNGWENPVKYLRSFYCIEAVDTIPQEKYVYDTLALPFPDDTGRKPAPKVQMPTQSDGIGAWWHQQDEHMTTQIWNDKTKKWEPKPAGIVPPAGTVSSKLLLNAIPAKMCPVCQEHISEHVTTYGLCKACANEFGPKIISLAASQNKLSTAIRVINSQTKICFCGDEHCSGIWMCTCGHVVHDQTKASQGHTCDTCYSKNIYVGKSEEELCKQHTLATTSSSTL